MISNSQLKSVLLVDDDAAKRAASDRRDSVVTACTAVAAMNEERATIAHFSGLLRVKVEGARFGNGRLMHRVDAISKLV